MATLSSARDTFRSLGALVLRAAIPFQELNVQLFEFFLGQVGVSLLRHKVLEPWERSLVSRVEVLRTPTIDPVLRGLEPLPPGYDRGNTRLLPFRVARRFGEFIDSGKQRIDEPRHLLVPLAFFRPIEHRKEDAGCDGIDLLAGRDQVWIFIAGELRREIEVLEPLIVRDRNQVQAPNSRS